MTRVDTSRWGRFRMGDLFTAQTGDVDLQQRDVNDKGVYFVNSGLENCGVKGKTDKVAQIFPANTITVDFWGFAFYRDFEYKMATHNHVFSLSGDIIKNKFVGMFLATAMSYFPQKFSYKNMGTWSKIQELPIWLPVTTSGNPDYVYMESYMQSILWHTEFNLEAFLSVRRLSGGIDTSGWKEFVIGDLFDIHPTKSYQMTNNELLEDDGENPVIVNTGFNNGVGGYTNQKCTEQAGVITFTDTAAKSTDSFFYQDTDFVGYPHVQGMYAKNHVWTEYEALFLTSIIKSYLRGRYDFISKMTRVDIMNLTVKLPVTASGEPDYGYMGAYMKDIITVADSNLGVLL